MRNLPALCMGLSLAACANPSAMPTGAPTTDTRPIGAPVNCIAISHIRSTQVRDGRTIDFELRNGETYRNTLPNACPGLSFERSFSYSTSLARICSVDIITLVNNSSGPPRGPGCGLGKFQRIDTSGS